MFACLPSSISNSNCHNSSELSPLKLRLLKSLEGVPLAGYKVITIHDENIFLELQYSVMTVGERLRSQRKEWQLELFDWVFSLLMFVNWFFFYLYFCFLSQRFTLIHFTIVTVSRANQVTFEDTRICVLYIPGDHRPYSFGHSDIC